MFDWNRLAALTCSDEIDSCEIKERTANFNPAVNKPNSSDINKSRRSIGYETVLDPNTSHAADQTNSQQLTSGQSVGDILGLPENRNSSSGFKEKTSIEYNNQES